MAFTEQGQSDSIGVFDAGGQIQQRIPVGWISDSSAWAALDTNGDGKEELLSLCTRTSFRRFN